MGTHFLRYLFFSRPLKIVFIKDPLVRVFCEPFLCAFLSAAIFSRTLNIHTAHSFFTRPFLNCIFCDYSSRSPVCHPWLVEGHEVDLAAGAALGRAEEDFVVALAEELEALRLLVHEHAVQVAGLDRSEKRFSTLFMN